MVVGLTTERGTPSSPPPSTVWDEPCGVFLVLRGLENNKGSGPEGCRVPKIGAYQGENRKVGAVSTELFHGAAGALPKAPLTF